MPSQTYITSTQIADWAKTKQAQSDLPRLIRRLIHATVKPSSCDFPAGDSTSLPGWDGELMCKEETTWTPKGCSYWELSCRDDVTTKTNEDYEKRTEQTELISRNQSTLVMVTARKWSGKKKWLIAKNEAKEWQSIRAYDADDLEQWLEQCPAVALQFAEELGFSNSSVESVEKYWNIWSHQARPALTVETFHSSREQSRNCILNDLRKNLQSHQSVLCGVQADSVEEAVAFVCSILITEPDLAASSLVITDSTGWSIAEKHPSLKIAIAAHPEIAERPFHRNGLTVIIPHAIGDFSGSNNRDNPINWVIERPNIYQFEKSLTTIGHSEGEAHRIAKNTGRSWSVYRRRFAVNPAISHPSWLKKLDKSQAAALSTLCLLGSWSGDNKADKDVVSFLADCDYEAVEKALRYLSKLDDAPVLLIGSVWKAKSALELLHLFGEQITHAELERFFDKTLVILSEPAPELELPENKRYMAQIYGKVRPQSKLLIDSLADTLIKLAVIGKHVPALANAHIVEKIDKLVRDLLTDADEARWLSLSSLLPALAEAAPSEFIKAIEKSLNQPNAPVSRLITETKSSGIMGGCCWHAGLLWALETLAWPPSQFPRVAMILARLVHIPYDSNWSNKPMGSLVSLFRSWIPQTAADIEQRIVVLDKLIKQEPEVAFSLLNSLVDALDTVSMPTHRPKWRNDDAGFGRGVSNFERHQMLIAAADRLIALSAQQSSRIITIIRKLNIFDIERIEKILALLKPYTEPLASDEEREILRTELRNKIYWYRNYGDKDNNGSIDVNALEQLYHRLEPTDMLVRYRWLFNQAWIDDISWKKSDDYNEQAKRVEALRLEALQKIYIELGMLGVEQLALSCKQPYWIGSTSAKLGINDAELAIWIVDKGDDFILGKPLVETIRGLLGALNNTQALELITTVIKLGKQQSWNIEKIARCFTLLPQNMTVWRKVAEYEIESEFWLLVQLNFYRFKQIDELNFVLHHLLNSTLLNQHRPIMLKKPIDF